MRFWLVTTPTIATTSAVWTESLTGTSRVSVTNGLFSVMLGSSSPLTSVDFNQTLYLAVEIGGTAGSPTWDGEMSPRKVIGTVPAAFEARRLEGLASTSFLRSDEPDTMNATSASTLLTLNQGGAGAIARLFGGGSEVFTVLGNGRVGIGTSTPWTGLVVDNDMALTGGLYDNDLTRGQAGEILQTDGSGVFWTSTSSLGFGTSNVATLNDLTDVIISSAATGELLSYNGSQWVDVATSTLGIALGDTTGTLDVNRGGTGLSSYSSGDLIYASGASTLDIHAVFDGDWHTIQGRGLGWILHDFFLFF
jgi:hypothetical protein